MIYFVGLWYNYSSLWWKPCELTTMKLGTMIGKYFLRYKVRMATFLPGYEVNLEVGLERTQNQFPGPSLSSSALRVLRSAEAAVLTVRANAGPEHVPRLWRAK